MSRLQSERGLADVTASLMDRQRATKTDERLQIGSLDIFHRQVVSLPVLSGAMSLDDDRMIEQGNSMHFAQKTLLDRRVTQQVLADQLDRLDPAEVPLPGLE